MQAQEKSIVTHPAGEQPMVEDRLAIADTFAGRVHVEWDATAPVTPFGQLPFFIDYLKQAGLFDAWVADCPWSLTTLPRVLGRPNAPKKRDLLGTVLLSVLAGHRRYAHMTALRCDPVNPPLLGMRKVASEDSVRRGLAKVGEAKGLPWLQNHLDYCTAPLLSEPWVLDMDSTVKTLYGHQEGAEVGYNPHKPGRPSHAYHTDMLSSLRLILRVDVLPGNEYNVSHATDGLWALLDHLGPSRRPALLRGDKSWGIERVAGRAKGLAISVSSAHDRQRKTIARTSDAAVGLDGCRPRLAGQGDQPEAKRLEPSAPDRVATSQTGSQPGTVRSQRPCATAAWVRRGRTRRPALGIRRLGHFAGQ
jgi:hypothetical protein